MNFNKGKEMNWQDITENRAFEKTKVCLGMKKVLFWQL